MLEKNVGLLMFLYQTLLKKTKSHKQSFAVNVWISRHCQKVL